MKTLLVEDNPGDVRLIQVALDTSRSNVDLFVTDDGVKALEFLKREGRHAESPRPDFVLLDLKLPRKGGLEVLAEMKRDPSLRRIPVIVLTSSKASGDVARAYDLQAAALFVKPMTGLEDTIERILRFITSAELPGNGDDVAKPAGASQEEASALYAAPPGPAERFEIWPRERQLAAIVDSSVDPVIGTTLDGTIATWNRAAEQLYGYTAEQAIGQNLRLTVPSEGSAELESVLAMVRRGRRVRHFDTVRIDRDGARTFVSTSASPVHDARGAIVGVSLNARDVTVRPLAEDRYRVAVEWSPNAIVMVDARGTIVLVNAETERLFGYRRAEILGKSIEILVPDRLRRRHAGQRAEFMERPAARAMGAGPDLFALRKDGSEFPVEIGLRPIDTPEGSVVISAIVDITERKRLDDILAQRTRELARSNAELEQFAYVASHDLQEPLRTVASYAQLLERQYGDRLDEDGRTFIRFAREGALRMQSLIAALLAYSRVGTRTREMRPTDAGAALDVALANLGSSLEASGAEILRGDLPTITSDATQLVELFQNLIGNAVKFRDAGRPRVRVEARRGEGGWVFSVSDNGIGIGREYFDRIFQVFQRLHGREEYPGTGIGLAICKRIVERMGGRIWVESDPGRGSTFFFTAPDGADAPPARPAETPE